MFVSQSFFPAMTKIVGTLGPRSRSVEIISGCLKAGMSGIHTFSPFQSPSFHACFRSLLISNSFSFSWL